MKTVILLRHAKSSWDHPGLKDHDRPLSKRGRQSAKAMAGWLAKNGAPPGLVLCSTAQRTQQTLEALTSWLGKKCNVELEPSLYLASMETMLKLIQKAPKSCESVMIIAHNPGTEDLAQWLIGPDGANKKGTDADALERLMLKYPTGAMAQIQFDIGKWKDVAPGLGQLKKFIRPRDLMG